MSDYIPLGDPDYKAPPTDAELYEQRERVQNQIRYHEGMVEALERQEYNIQAELARRALAAYWLAHPDLTPFEVGDKVVITDEYQDYYRRTSANQHPLTRTGEIYAIGDIQFTYGNQLLYSLEGRGGRIPYSIVKEMRRAYLEREAKPDAHHPT